MDCSGHTSLPTGCAGSSIVRTTSISLCHRRSPDHALGNRELVALLFVAGCHLGEWDGIVVLRVACLPEGLHTSLDDLLHRGAGRLEVVAGVELGRVLGEGLADRARCGEAKIGVDVDLPHAVLDTLLDLPHGHAPRRLYLAAVLIDYVHELL